MISFRTKIVRCPSCSQQLRVPIKFGKRLRIRCQRCSTQFDISYKLNRKHIYLFLIALALLFLVAIWEGAKEGEYLPGSELDEIII